MSIELLQQELHSLRQRNIHIESQLETLTQTTSILENVINNIADPIFVKDEQHRWVIVNDAFCEFLGHRKVELIGRSDYDFFPKEQADISWESDDLVLTLGLEDLNEETITSTDGSLKIISTRKNRCQLEDGSKILIGTFRDITADKAELPSQKIRKALKDKVVERTKELQKTVSQLQQEITDRQQVENALRHKTSELEAIFRALPDLYFRMDWHGTILDYKASTTTNLYTTPEEFLGKRMPDYLPGEVGKQFSEAFAQVRQSRSLVTIEYELAMPEGKRSFEARLLPLGDDELIAIIRDISDRKSVEKRRQHIENTIRAQEQFLRNIYEGVDYLISVYNVSPDSHFRLMEWNSSTEKATGIRTSEAIGKTLPEIFGTTEGAAIQQNFERCLVAETVITYEECRCFQGRETWWFTTLNPIKDSKGKIYRLVGTTFDISDRKRAEEQLRQSEQRFRDVSEAAGEYLWETDAKGVYTFVTDKVKLVKGYSPDELLGHSSFEFMPDEDINQVRTILQDAHARKTSYKLEHRNITRTGEVVWEEVSGVPLFNRSGEIIGFRGTGLSITERKQAELQLRQSEAKLRQQARNLEHTLRELQRTQSQLIQSEKMSSLGQLVAGVAHEINNPVNFIYGNLVHTDEYAEDLLHLLHLYQKYYPNPAAEIQAVIDEIDSNFLINDLPKLIGSMRAGAERIQRIVASLRNFSRMDEAEFKEVNIHAGIESTLMILQNRLKAKSIQTAGIDWVRPELQVIKKYGNLPLIECYAGQLNQVFMNILSNAIDAIEEHDSQRSPAEIQQSPGAITIQTQMLDDDRLEIRIADNGIGMNELTLRRLFDPFFTTKAVGKGTGMGLSISYQIITDRHQGSLRCTSAPGQGAEFIIEIPSHQTAKAQ